MGYFTENAYYINSFVIWTLEVLQTGYTHPYHFFIQGNVWVLIPTYDQRGRDPKIKFPPTPDPEN
jgi:hypothetical protein